MVQKLDDGEIVSFKELLMYRRSLELYEQLGDLKGGGQQLPGTRQCIC